MSQLTYRPDDLSDEIDGENLGFEWPRLSPGLFFDNADVININLECKHEIRGLMPGKSPNLKLEEMPGNQFQNLEDAQSEALKATEADFLKKIRALLEPGVLIVKNGKVVPSPDKKPKEKKK